MSEPKIRGYRKIEELKGKVTGSDSITVEEARSVEALSDFVGEDVRNVLPEVGAEEQADSLQSFAKYIWNLLGFTKNLDLK